MAPASAGVPRNGSRPCELPDVELGLGLEIGNQLFVSVTGGVHACAII